MFQKTIESWRIAALLGVTTVGFAAYIGTVFPTSNLGFPEGYGTAVIAFEFARTPADVHAVFGPPDGLDRDTLSRMDWGNWLDFGFMAVYGAFLFAFHRATVSIGSPSVATLLGPVAAVCDAFENTILLGITSDLSTMPGLPWLRLWVTLKFAALAVSAGVGGFTMLRTPHPAVRIGGAFAAGCGLVALLALVAPDRLGEALVSSIALAWALFLTFAIGQSVRGSPSRFDRA
ncbi:MAG: hypothetical protein AAGA48_37585 [Myxococcota bacterium]